MQGLTGGLHLVKKKFNSTWRILFTMAVIGILEGYALSKGIDGHCLAISLAAISGLGGFAIGNQRGKNGKR